MECKKVGEPLQNQERISNGDDNRNKKGDKKGEERQMNKGRKDSKIRTQKYGGIRREGEKNKNTGGGICLAGQKTRSRVRAGAIGPKYYRKQGRSGNYDEDDWCPYNWEQSNICSLRVLDNQVLSLPFYRTKFSVELTMLGRMKKKHPLSPHHILQDHEA
ncbi:hypothetical protein RUM43_008294 [Polyplax serrata]|uniref:Uncharacterized protein n=1 Tax=Polyplax serrata TaxID=468196 RepID=A0AAN8PNV6_POLSC